MVAHKSLGLISRIAGEGEDNTTDAPINNVAHLQPFVLFKVHLLPSYLKWPAINVNATARFWIL